MTLLSERFPAETAALSELLQRIRAEYLQMPGLKLTAPQAGGCGDPTGQRAMLRLLRSWRPSFSSARARRYSF